MSGKICTHALKDMILRGACRPDASDGKANPVHDEGRNGEDVAGMAPDSSRKGRAELACEGERAAENYASGDACRPGTEPREAPQDRDGEGAGVDGEREEERADDVGEHEREQQGHDAVQEYDDARLEKRFVCEPCGGMRVASLLGACAGAEQPWVSEWL